MLTPAIYRTRITHLRRAPVHHYFEHRSYSWYVDIDRLPELPRWLRPFARFEASDHLDGAPDDTLRQRVDNFLADHGIDLRGGTVTALLQARVLGYVFNPLSLFWCHDADGVLRHVIAEVHNTYGGRHAYLLPPDAGAARDGDEEALRFAVQRGRRLLPGAGAAAGRRTQRDDFAAPGEPARIRRDDARRQAARRYPSDTSTAVDGAGGTADGSSGIRVQGITLWLRRVPVVPRPIPDGREREKERVEQL